MTCKYMFPKDLCLTSKIVLKFYDDILYNVTHTNLSNDCFMNTHCHLQTYTNDSNNDLKGVESIAATADYISKYISKDEPKDDILIELHKKIKNIDEYNPNQSIVGKWMSLIIT